MIAHIYIRFSTIEQREGTSTRRQKDECFSHLTNKGWSLGQVMVDEGRSAFSGDNRSEGAALAIFEQEAAIGQHRDSILLVERLDRLSRQGHEDTFELIRRFSRYGVHVATVDGSAFYRAGEKLNLTDIITMLVKAELALDESVKKSERLKSAYKIRRADAEAAKKPMGKNCPAWLYIEDGAYKVAKAKAKVIKDIWTWADQGMGALTIAKKLNRDGIEPWERWGRKAKAWDRARISKILTDPAVIGEYQPHVMEGGKRVKHGEPIKLFPQIVDPEVFARVRSTADSLVHQGRRQVRDYHQSLVGTGTVFRVRGHHGLQADQAGRLHLRGKAIGQYSHPQARSRRARLPQRSPRRPVLQPVAAILWRIGEGVAGRCAPARAG